jgi:hypothetical protein
VRDQRAGSTGGCRVDRRHRSIQISWILKKTSRFVVSHISRKTSEMWGTRRLVEGKELKRLLPNTHAVAPLLVCRLVEGKELKRLHWMKALCLSMRHEFG